MLIKKIKFGLTTQIFLALVLGVIFGVVCPQYAERLQPLGDVFLRMIKMIVVPLIFSSLVMGIASNGDFKTVGRLGAKALIWFEIATTAALLIGLIAGNVLQPGAGVLLTSAGDAGAGAAAAKKSVDLVQMLVNVVPTNIVDSLAKGNMLQIVFFSIFFGIATVAAGTVCEPVLKIANGVAHAMFKLTEYVMRLAPIGIFGTISYTVGKFGLGMIIPLGKLILALYLSLVVFVLLLIAAGSFFAKVNIFRLMRAVKEPLVIAFTTTSSEAALPLLLERLQEMGIPTSIVNFVVPLGYSFNLDGGTLYTSLAILFIAQVYGIPLALGEQLLIIVTLMLATKGMAAVSGAVIVTIAAGAAAFGLPMEGVALILGIDRILDMGRTATNVIGHTVATIIVARWEHAFPNEVVQLAYTKQYGLTTNAVSSSLPINEEIVNITNVAD